MEPAIYEKEYRAILERLSETGHMRSGQDIRQLIVQCLLPAMMRDAARAVSRGRAAPAFLPGDLDHIADWLGSAMAAELKWLRNLDQEGVPKKFSKLVTVEDVKAEANRGLDRLIRDTLSKPAAEGEEELVAVLADGYTLVSLISPLALDRESKEMQHCVGLGGYDEGVRAGEIAIYSLRDRRGKAHATMEVRIQERHVVQAKGKQNRFPARKYFDLLLPWLAEQGYGISREELAGGYFMQTNGVIRHVEDLAAGEEIEGSMTLRFDGDEDVDLVLPEGLRISGELSIRAEYAAGKKVVFGANTVVRGQMQTTAAVVMGIENVSANNLRIIAGELSAVPDGSRISGHVYISGTKIGDILERAVFEGGLEIRDIERLTIPSAISVRGPVVLAGSELVRVEEGVSLTGDMTIQGGLGDPVLTAARNLSVGGSLSISGFSAFLSDGLHVGEKLSIQFSELERLPSKMEVGGLAINQVKGVSVIPASAVVNGDVSILKSDITNLAGRRVWPGDLRIPHMQINHLPFGLTVGGTLEVSWTPLVEFPQAMRIAGGLTAVGCKAGRIPEDAVIGGTIDLSRNDDAGLPDDTVVHGELKLDGSYFKRMPMGVKVEGMLSLGEFPVDRICRHFEAKSYVLSEAFVIDVSDLTEIEENIWIDAKDLSKLPEGMTVGEKLIVKGNLDGARLPDGITVRDYVRVLDSDEVPPSLIPPTAIIGGTRTNSLRL
ncbi:PcfJ domain-containing protein [Rhizobium sp. BK176]|uniref:PcfJ domain-containing protein n=1 Tax=Rhizobium sp. BK176 TaxID=2587071 RepID=UPI00216841B9|nr:PcfJ domain-containing protein [Rhizobium sp. BK176]MCS4088760.1 hypothetical protein [Rhizobium sp. BK176]